MEPTTDHQATDHQETTQQLSPELKAAIQGFLPIFKNVVDQEYEQKKDGYITEAKEKIEDYVRSEPEKALELLNNISRNQRAAESFAEFLRSAGAIAHDLADENPQDLADENPQEELQKERDQFKGEREELQKERDQFKGEREELQKERDQFKGERDQFEKWRDDLHEELKRKDVISRESTKLLQEKVKELTAMIELKTGDFNKLQTAATAFENKNESLQSQVDSLRQNKLALESTLNTLNGIAATQKPSSTDNPSSQDKIASLESELHAAKGISTDRAEEVKKLERQIVALTQQNDNLKQQGDMQKAIQEMHKDIKFIMGNFPAAEPSPVAAKRSKKSADRPTNRTDAETLIMEGFALPTPQGATPSMSKKRRQSSRNA
jgi:DNA repair exonuclease SbcCD ATPase subunit